MSEPKRPHGSRFRDALLIVSPGACNPSGVALSEANGYAAVTASRHWLAASARKIRSVARETRWR